MKKELLISLAILLSIQLASAIVVDSVQADTLAPGREGRIIIEIENVLEKDAEDVTLTLNFQDVPFIPIGTSEQTAEEIDEDDDEEYHFIIKAAHDISPGDYEIPYTLNFKINDEERERAGSIGIEVRANPELSFSASSDNGVVGQKGEIELTLVNKGFSDARFVSIRVFPEDFTLLSSSEDYIGEVDSDDFETSTFEVIFNEEETNFNAIIEYVNFDNEKIIKQINLPIQVYSREEAKSLGLTPSSNTSLIVGIVVIAIIVWILWRTIKKRKRLKKSMQKE